MQGRRGARTAERPGRALRVFSLIALAAMFAMMLAACGEEDNGGNGGNPPTPTTPPTATPTVAPPSPTITPDAIVHPMGRDDIVLIVEISGGFVPPFVLATELPTFVLTGDGRVIVQGPMIEIYPQPALPNLRVTQLTEEGVQAILRAAKEAGLLDGDLNLPYDGIADAPTTFVTTNAGGQVSVVSAYALGMEIDDSLATPEVAAAREKVAAFIAKLSDLSSWLAPNDIISQDEEYAITRMQIVTQPADLSFGSGDDSITPQVKPWPLALAPDAIGEPFFMEQSRCVVLEGADLETMLTALADANQLTRWTSGDAEYVVYIRPLIASQAGCVAPGNR